MTSFNTHKWNNMGVHAQQIGAKQHVYCMTQTAKSGIVTEHHTHTLSPTMLVVVLMFI